MKITKCFFAMILMVMLLVALFACANDTPIIGTNHTSPNTGIDQSNAETKDDQSGLDSESVCLDWVWVMNAYPDGALSEVGYYYLGANGMLSYADLAVEGSVILCSNAGCTHKNESCEAFVSNTGHNPMFFRNDKIYYVENNSLYLRNEDGTGLRKVSDVGMKYLKDQKSLHYRSFAVAENFLYMNVRVNSIVPDPATGGKKVSNELNSIFRIDLRTGKEEVLVEQKVQNGLDNLTLCAVHPDAVLFSKQTGIDVSKDDPKYDEKINQIQVSLEYYHIGTQRTKKLFQKSFLECSSFIAVANGKVYYITRSYTQQNDSGYCYAYDLQTDTDELVCKESFLYLGKNYCLKADRDTDIWYVFNLETREKLPCEYQKSMLVRSMSDAGFVLYRLMEEEDGSRLLVYDYIPYTALSDGLQEGDMKPLYSIEVWDGH